MNTKTRDRLASVRVLVADDQPVVRDGVGLLLEAVDGFETVGSVATCEELLRAVRDLTPDVILLDIGPEGDDCLRTSQRLKLRHPEVAVLLFPTRATGDQVRRALACGANGILLKDAPVPEVLESISTVAHGGVVVGADLAEPGSSQLSRREREVLRLLADGLSNRDISRSLFISVGTTKRHVENISRKLGTTNRAAAVAEALRRGLVA
ncbi:MAG TPA: response regulator transcription factor [Acidimicrobiales bacterium]